MIPTSRADPPLSYVLTLHPLPSLPPHRLEELDLSQSGLQLQGLQSLRTALVESGVARRLVRLILSQNWITSPEPTSEGGPTLADLLPNAFALGQCPALEELRLAR